jgi:hypothetical protein
MLEKTTGFAALYPSYGLDAGGNENGVGILENLIGEARYA